MKITSSGAALLEHCTHHFFTGMQVTKKRWLLQLL